MQVVCAYVVPRKSHTDRRKESLLRSLRPRISKMKGTGDTQQQIAAWSEVEFWDGLRMLLLWASNEIAVKNFCLMIGCSQQHSQSIPEFSFWAWCIPVRPLNQTIARNRAANVLIGTDSGLAYPTCASLAKIISIRVYTVGLFLPLQIFPSLEPPIP